MKKNFILLLTAFCIGLCGCGGGSGDSTGVDPRKLEYSAILTTFFNSVNQSNYNSAMKCIGSSLIYNDNKGHEDFRQRLDVFINGDSEKSIKGAENINYTINGEIGVDIEDDDNKTGTLRANVSGSYDVNGNTVYVPEEMIEVRVSGKYTTGWMITNFKKYDTTGSGSHESAFPPVLTAN